MPAILCDFNDLKHSIITWGGRGFVFQEEGFQLPMLSLCFKMIEYANTFLCFQKRIEYGESGQPPPPSKKKKKKKKKIYIQCSFSQNAWIFIQPWAFFFSNVD